VAAFVPLHPEIDNNEIPRASTVALRRTQE